MFTLDKTVTAIIKQVCGDRGEIKVQVMTWAIFIRTQVQGVLADQKSLDLRSLLEGVRSTEDPTNRDIIRYRREAETNVGSDEHLYRVDWVSALLVYSYLMISLLATSLAYHK